MHIANEYYTYAMFCSRVFFFSGFFKCTLDATGFSRAPISLKLHGSYIFTPRAAREPLIPRVFEMRLRY